MIQAPCSVLTIGESFEPVEASVSAVLISRAALDTWRVPPPGG